MDEFNNKKNINGNNGFTLVEVVVSIAILALVIGAILQLFSTSARIDRRAYDIDGANSKVNQIMEEIKLDPATKTNGTQYYKIDWTSCLETDAVYKVESVIVIAPTPTLTPKDQIMPAGVTHVLAASERYINIEKDLNISYSSGIIATIGPTPTPVFTPTATPTVIPSHLRTLNLDCIINSAAIFGTSPSITLNINNQTPDEFAIYCSVLKDKSININVDSTSKGLVSITNIVNGKAVTKKYTITVTARLANNEQIASVTSIVTK